MKVVKGTHKKILFELFSHDNGMGGMVPVNFAIEKLDAAIGAKKKLMPIVRTATPEEAQAWLDSKGLVAKTPEQEAEFEKLKTTLTLSTFVDGEVEFDPSEVEIVKGLYDAKREWPAEEVFSELYKIFYPAKPLPTEA